MSLEENKALVHRFWQSANEGNIDVIEQMTTPDFIYHDTQGDMSRDDWKQYEEMVLAAFPGIHLTIEDIIVEGDKVVTRATITGTHKGEFRGIAPTGKTATITAIYIFRIAGGKFAESWVVSDRLGLMQQLGVMPPPRQSAI